MSSLMRRAFMGGVTDPFFANVVLLAHMDGTNGGSTFVDSSSFNRTFTNIGTPTTSTTQVKFGATSMRNPGVNSGISATTSAIGTSDFTMEGWLYLDSLTGNQVFWLDSLFLSTGFELYVDATGKLHIFAGGAERCTSTSAITAGTWVHVAFTRTSGTVRWFINGTLDATTASVTDNFTATTYYMGYSSNALIGYMDDVRFTFGVSRYTTTFTPPTVAYPNS